MKFKLLLVALCAPVLLFAQSNFKSGYILNSNGDTLKGYINYKEWEQSPKYIEFKQTVSSNQPSRFYPKMVKAFTVDGMDEYITYTGPISMDANTFPDLPNGIDTTVVQDTVFLHLIYQGKPLSLLSYKDKMKLRFFIQETGGQPFEIKYYQYYAYNTRNQVREFKPYTTTFNQLAEKYNASDAEIKLDIDRSRYTESSLLDIVKRINKDKATSHSISGGSRFIAGISLNRTAVKIDGNTPFNGQSTTKYFPSISAGIDLFLNKYTQRLIFRNELAFSAASAEYNAAEGDLYYNYKLSQSTISFRPQIIYNIYNRESLQFYLGVMFSINYSFYGKNRYINTFYSTRFEGNKYYALNSFWGSFPFQAGVIINRRFDLYATYLPSNSFSSQANFSISQSIYGFGAHYYFK